MPKLLNDSEPVPANGRPDIIAAPTEAPTPDSRGALRPGPSGGIQILTLMPRLMAAVGTVEKDGKNEQQRYKFRAWEDVARRVQAACAAVGVTVVSTIERARVDVAGKTQSGASIYRAEIRMRVYLYAPDGSCIWTDRIGEGLDSSDKAANKAETAATKYALIHALLIGEGGEDADEQTPEVYAGKGKPQPVAAPRGKPALPKSAAPSAPPAKEARPEAPQSFDVAGLEAEMRACGSRAALMEATSGLARLAEGEDKKRLRALYVELVTVLK
jgi:hypothetical protein